ncbi:hypothetical protein [Muricoccus pecuniae]|uniref:Uncharacterized protein n=1 Tax=Muricoccus pecuniae TaxID=693023 RepID=A0A840Y2U7_9PROT|nr:hypothetical protein [Roseomonas pecuniae]MBB5694476.1 hypothetical protein [Roseomonas pecuniae]
MMRWALGLAVLFALLALLARVLQLGFSLALIVVAGLALLAAIVTAVLGRAGLGGGPPDGRA